MSKIATKLPGSVEGRERFFRITLVRGSWDMEGEPVQGSCCCLKCYVRKRESRGAMVWLLLSFRPLCLVSGSYGLNFAVS